LINLFFEDVATLFQKVLKEGGYRHTKVVANPAIPKRRLKSINL